MGNKNIMKLSRTKGEVWVLNLYVKVGLLIIIT